MDDSESPAPTNRYPASDEWHAVDRYFASTLLEEDGVLTEARRSGAVTTMPNAEVAANQGAFLSLLVKIADAERVLEFGTLAGYSTIWFARAVGEMGMSSRSKSNRITQQSPSRTSGPLELQTESKRSSDRRQNRRRN